MSTINLLPEDFLQRRTRTRATVICSVLFALVMVGVGAAYVAQQRSYELAVQEHERVNADYVEAAKLISQMQQLQNQRHRLVAKAKRSAKLMERVPRSYLLSVVTNALPKGTSLHSFEMQSRTITPKRRASAAGATKFGQVAAQAAPPKPYQVVEIKLVGLAATDVQVARMIANLARSSLTESVDLVYSKEKEIDEDMIRQFELELVLKPDVDAKDAIEMATEIRELKNAPLAKANGVRGS